MKAKSLIVLLLAGIWGVGSWWWYTCKVKGFCGADTSSAQIAAGTAVTGAAALSGSASDAVKNDKADADEKAKADADKAAADAKADADKVTMEATSNNQNGDIGPATLTFPTGSANPQLAASTKAYFEKVAQFLKDNSNAKVTIVGHTDNKGDPAKNKALGLKRAEMLQKTLIDLGAPKDRVSAASEGADKPIADNNTEEGRKKNRRVEITPVK